MDIGVTVEEKFARARADLRIGLPVVLRGGTDRLMVAAAETLPDSRSELFGAGAVLAITGRRAETLKVPVYDGDLVRLILPAGAGPGWVRAVTDPASDLDMPLKGPFATVRQGSASLHRFALRLCKAAHLLPAALCVGVRKAPHGLVELDISAAPASGLPVETISAQVPLALAPQSRLHVFRQGDGAEEHYAVETGRPDRDKPVLCRLHSACFTGDVLGSLRCDCGSQLSAALARIAEQGGVLLYLSQEGRGIGMANKMRAYSLQDQGFDTFEANHRLGFEDDERDFEAGANMLKSLGFSQVRLLTNNPAKVARLEALGIRVAERVPLITGRTEENKRYLATKAAKSGHML